MSSYWEDRVVREQERLLNNSIDTLNHQVRKCYIQSAKRLRAKLRVLYEEIQIDAKEGTLLISDLYKYNRYYEMISAIEKELKILGDFQAEKNVLKFEKLYLDNSKVVGKSLGFGTNPNIEAARQSINSIWCADGLSWKARIWKDKTKLGEELKQTLIDCISTGRSYAEAAEALSMRMGVSYSNSEKLVRTEMAHIQTESTLERYREAGIEQYEILVEAGDACDDCLALEGKVFNLAEQILPVHPNCRCCAIPHRLNITLDEGAES